MHVARDQFLAGAGLADDQHVRVASTESGDPAAATERGSTNTRRGWTNNGCASAGRSGSVRTGGVGPLRIGRGGSRVEARRRIGSLERPFADLANLVRERIVGVGCAGCASAGRAAGARRAGAGDVEHPRAEIGPVRAADTFARRPWRARPQPLAWCHRATMRRRAGPPRDRRARSFARPRIRRTGRGCTDRRRCSRPARRATAVPRAACSAARR